MTASEGTFSPFQSHSPTISITGVGSAVGAARNSAKISNKFDFPDPFAPMSTFNPRIGRSIPFGPNDSNPETFNRLIKSFSTVPVPFV